MKKILILFWLITSFQISCAKSSTPKATISPEIKTLDTLILKGNYNDAIKMAKAIISATPQSADTAQALYLEGYVFAFDKSELASSRLPLRQLLTRYPQCSYTIAAQRLIADTQYWQGHYSEAVEEYKKLATMDPSQSLYSKMQIGKCLLLDDKVNEALADFRELVEKNPGTAIADSAQLLIANTYLKLENVTQAKKELRKLIRQSQNHAIQDSAQNALRQIEEEAILDKNQDNTNE